MVHLRYEYILDLYYGFLGTPVFDYSMECLDSNSQGVFGDAKVLHRSLTPSNIYQAINAAIERDEKVKELVEVMDTALSFLTDAESIPITRAREKVLSRMLVQLAECSHFICDYGRNPDFCGFPSSSFDNTSYQYRIDF